MQVTGMLLGMCGTIIVSIGDAILNAATSCFRLIRGGNKKDDSFELDERLTGHYERLK